MALDNPAFDTDTLVNTDVQALSNVLNYEQTTRRNKQTIEYFSMGYLNKEGPVALNTVTIPSFPQYGTIRATDINALLTLVKNVDGNLWEDVRDLKNKFGWNVSDIQASSKNIVSGEFLVGKKLYDLKTLIGILRSRPIEISMTALLDLGISYGFTPREISILTSGCSGYCRGLCTSCTGNCTDGCSGGSTGSSSGGGTCPGDCTGQGCMGSCGAGCSAGCSVSTG